MLKICPKCHNLHDKLGKFCSRHCANSRVFSDESRKKKSDANKKWYAGLSEQEKELRREKYTLVNSHHRMSEKTKQALMNSRKKYTFTEDRINKLRTNAKKNNPMKRPEIAKKLSEKLRGRKLSETHVKNLSGERSSQWKGGISYLPYCASFNDKTKEEVRCNFGRVCVICKLSEAHNKQKLSVHHVDYNKNDICNGKKWSLIPLCKRCHGITNSNRWYWFNLLMNYWAMESIDLLNDIQFYF